MGPGELIIVNDTHHDLMFRVRWGRGPNAAVRAFLAENDDFTRQDKGHRKALFSATRGGYLLRAGKRRPAGD